MRRRVDKDTHCEDGLRCNGIETCQAGVCTAGSPLPCGMDMTALDLLPVVDLIGPDLSGADLLAPAPVDLAAASADLTAAVDLAAGDAPAGAEDLGGGADMTAAEDLTAGDDLAQAYLDLTSTAAADASEDAAADVDAAAVPADASVVSHDLSVPIGTPKDGCACHVASPRELPGTAVLVLFVLLALRRRARRDGPHA